MTTDEMDLRDTARGLARLYGMLEDVKHSSPPPREVRVMAATPGPRSPTRDGILDWEAHLIEEKPDVDARGHQLPPEEVIPGGLRTMVIDAAQHIGNIPSGIEVAGGVPLCRFVADHAGSIACAFPAADDLLELMEGQARWLSWKIGPSGPTPIRFLTLPSIRRALATRGITVPDGTIRRWASEGTVAVGVSESGKRAFLLADVLAQAAGRGGCLTSTE